MAQYTTEAFQWSGTGYNSQYNSSVTATLDDDDATYQGAGDGDETISIDGGAFQATTGSPYTISVSFSDTNGDPHVEDFFFFNTGGNWYFIPGPGSAFSVGATLGSYQSHTSTGWDYADVICFTQNTKIATPIGDVLVQDLQVGDLVITKDNGLQSVRWIGKKYISGARMCAYPKLRPVRIKAHAFGENVPETDMMVSPQHRMFLHSKQAQMMFGEAEVLVPAKGLISDKSVVVAHEARQVTYYHVLFDQHQLVMANGTWSESFHPGETSFEAIEKDARDELFEIFPELWSDPVCYGASARHSLKVSEGGLVLPDMAA